MFTRTTGLFIIPCWLAAMGWLVAHDLLPQWVAPPPPTVQRSNLVSAGGHQAEYTISNEFGPIGSLWSSYLVDEGSIRRDDLVWIEHLPVELVPLRITVHSVFTAEGVLDEFEVRLENPSTLLPVKLHGERFHSDFSFRLESGPTAQTFKIPLTQGGLISGLFNPLAEFGGLSVGQTWQMQIFNPLAALTNVGRGFIPVLVRVTGEERIRAGAWEGNCLIVEAGNTKAWVGAKGELRMQEMTIPMMGNIRIVREESFNAERRSAVRRMNIGRNPNEVD